MKLPKDRTILITDEGSRVLNEMQGKRYINLNPEDKAMHDILLELALSPWGIFSYRVTIRIFLMPGRDSIIGRHSKGRPCLSALYEKILGILINSKYVTYG